VEEHEEEELEDNIKNIEGERVDDTLPQQRYILVHPVDDFEEVEHLVHHEDHGGDVQDRHQKIDRRNPDMQLLNCSIVFSKEARAVGIGNAQSCVENLSKDGHQHQNRLACNVVAPVPLEVRHERVVLAEQDVALAQEDHSAHHLDHLGRSRAGVVTVRWVVRN
jgi:hypothetical protein